jgi:hypothetical protein
VRNWSHLHTLASGLVFGLVLDRQALVIFALGIVLGAVIVLGARYARRAVTFAGEQAGRLSAARAEAHAAKARLDEAEAERKLAAAAELRARADARVRTAREQEKELAHAYRQGAADDEHHRELWLSSVEDGRRAS